jgi:hypothetical protein
LFKKFEDILSSEQIQAGSGVAVRVPILIGRVTHHGVCFTTASLTIGETGTFGPVEEGIN